MKALFLLHNGVQNGLEYSENSGRHSLHAAGFMAAATAGFIAGVTLRVGTVGNLYSLEQQCPALFAAGVPHAYGGQ